MNDKSSQSALYRLLVITGGTAMLIAVAVELVAVLGRQTVWPLPGSIELVQVMVTIAGTTALVIATLNNSHAIVRLLLDRLSGTTAIFLKRFNSLLSVVFFLCLFAGSVWLAADLWYGQEHTEIWKVSFRPLRIIVSLGTLLAAVLFLRIMLRRSES